MSWTPVQNFVTIRPGDSLPRTRDLRAKLHTQKVLVFWVLATRYSQGPWTDFDAKYANIAVLRKDVPFRGREHKI